MARPKTRTLTDVELEFMEVLWELGSASTEDVQKALRDQGRELADGSVRKFLSILMDKGYAARRPEGRGHLYQAIVPREKARGSMATDLLKRAFGGSPALMMATLLDSDAVSDKELKRIQELIEARESGAKTPGRARRKESDR